MTDRMIRGTFPGSGIRFAVCRTGELCNEAVGRLNADPIAGSLLSQALTCAALLSIGLKGEERLTLRWGYPGPIGTILADMNEKAEVRGFPHNARLAPEVGTVREAMGGDGMISGVTSFPGRVARQGTAPAVFGDVARDMAHFLSLSFQIETALVVGVNLPPVEPARVTYAGGILLQPLPGCELEFFDHVRRTLEEPTFREWMEAFPRQPEEMLEWVTAGEAPQILEETRPAFLCHCSREKVVSVLRMLDPAELQDMLEKDGQAEINCHFCASTYHFSRTDLQRLLQQSQAGHG